MEKDIKAINQKLARVGDYGRTASDVEQRLGSLATRIETIHQKFECVGSLEVRVHGLTENWDRVSNFEKDWREYENVCQHVQALMPLEPLVPALVAIDGTVATLSTQVQSLDEEVECLKRENASLRQEIKQATPLTTHTVTLMIQQMEERMSQKYDGRLQQHMELVQRRKDQYDLIFQGEFNGQTMGTLIFSA